MENNKIIISFVLVDCATERSVNLSRKIYALSTIQPWRLLHYKKGRSLRSGGSYGVTNDKNSKRQLGKAN